MKNANVSKINTLGKVSKVIVVILMAVIIAGIVATSLSAITMATLPEDAIQITGSAETEIVVDESKLGSLAGAMIKTGTLVNIPTTNIHFDQFGTDFSLNVIENKTDDTHYTYNIDGDITKFNCKAFGIAATMGCLAGILILVASLVSCIFGKRLADALAKCDSPFEDSVMKAMGNFGKSLIPMAVFMVVLRGLSGVSTFLAILVVLLFIQVFKYGAKLQKESDETL